ncbi:unnamed protein product [Eruca vesicaria subsp. sativa]|uniref:Uncharacterized protein n=1 Tax=Eruca vesicaria subsp. sativa TaxID=29727 RepID=A0ABC8JTL3_ERUVS|nr:unnamed protein product [Eruca vesicaria subsp. sativa]
MVRWVDPGIFVQRWSRGCKVTVLRIGFFRSLRWIRRIRFPSVYGHPNWDLVFMRFGETPQNHREIRYLLVNLQFWKSSGIIMIRKSFSIDTIKVSLEGFAMVSLALSILFQVWSMGI